MHKLINLICVTALLVTLASCGKEPVKEKNDAPRLIKAFTIKTDDRYSVRNYPAKVDADQKVDLSFLVSGRLIKLPIEEGKEVKQGQLIAKIDPKDYEIIVAQKKAEYDFAKVMYDRYAKLLPTDAISVAQYDEKKSLYALAKAHLDEAKKDLSDTEIYAPFAGVIGKRYVENHQFVQVRQEIANLQDIREIELVVYIPEQDVTNAEEIKRLEDSTGKSQVGEAEFSSIPNAKFPLTVKSVSTQADPSTQSYEIKFLMQRPTDRIILPGMTANVQLKFSDRGTNIQIPFASVLVTNDGKNYVWKVDKKTMRVVKTPVTLGKTAGENIDVIKGLHKGDTIAAAGAAYLTPDMKVKIQKNRIGR